MSLSKGLITQAIEQSAGDQLQWEETLKQAVSEMAQARMAGNNSTRENIADLVLNVVGELINTKKSGFVR